MSQAASQPVLEEAVDTGDRMLVYGRPATVLADLRLKSWPRDALPGLRARIQAMIQKNEPDPELDSRHAAFA